MENYRPISILFCFIFIFLHYWAAIIASFVNLLNSFFGFKFISFSAHITNHSSIFTFFIFKVLFLSPKFDFVVLLIVYFFLYLKPFHIEKLYYYCLFLYYFNVHYFMHFSKYSMLYGFFFHLLICFLFINYILSFNMLLFVFIHLLMFTFLILYQTNWPHYFYLLFDCSIIFIIFRVFCSHSSKFSTFDLLIFYFLCFLLFLLMISLEFLAMALIISFRYHPYSLW